MARREQSESQSDKDRGTSPRSFVIGYGWAITGVAAATLLFRLVRGELDKGQAPLLYLPVVIACAIRLGFGPAMLAVAGSFICWNFFFLPPYGTWAVADPKDWLSLVVFLAVAIATARLAAQARTQTHEAQARAQEARALQQASEQISAEIETDRILPALGHQLVSACAADFCAIYRAPSSVGQEPILAAVIPETLSPDTTRLAEASPWVKQAYEHGRLIGFASSQERSSPGLKSWAAREQSVRLRGRGTAPSARSVLSAPLLSGSLPFAAQDFNPGEISGAEFSSNAGVFAPLIADGQCRGVVHVGPRRDGCPFDRPQERLILALANHAAVALARQTLSDEAAQAQALREADELKNALLSLVSHELRTPLASIKASASGLLQDKDGWNTVALEEGLQAINEESDRLSGLVSKLLDLSRLEAGAWKPQWDWCDLVDVLGTVLARLPEREGRRVHVAAPPDLALVRADFVQIAQVMTNLLENALKYTPTEAPVMVALRSAGNDVQVSVTDAGPGIPPDEAEAVFERFHRLERHQKSGVPGTGLGLAICRGIIHAHGGRIWEQNGLDGGAIFAFTLPRAARFAAQPQNMADGDEPETDREVTVAARTHFSR